MPQITDIRDRQAFSTKNADCVDRSWSLANVPPVADDIVGVEVEGGEGDYLPAEGQGAGHLTHAQLTLKLKQ